MKGGDNMSDVEQAIRDLIEEQVSSVVEMQVEDAVSSHTELQDLQYKVEDLESKLDDTNDDDTIDLVVAHIIKKLIGDNNKVVAKSYVDNLQNEIAQLKSKLAETKPTE
tara:strand:+ start:352 stop:678 length:327 start_codon:yes stop_codon:yes gene_type:complete